MKLESFIVNLNLYYASYRCERAHMKFRGREGIGAREGDTC
jgi:hypothetical protein